MSLPFSPPDRLPSYTADPTPSSNDLIDPTTLLLYGQSIHSQDLSTPPLYTLSLSLSGLNPRLDPVKLTRLDYSIRTPSSPDSGPEVTARRLRLFNLVHPHKGTAPTFPLYLEAASSRAMASVGFASSGGPRWTGVRIVRCKGELAGREAMFEARMVNAGGVLWSQPRAQTPGDDKQDIVAVESEGQDQEGDTRMLRICRVMRQCERDCLVALWCLRVWDDESFRDGARGWSHCGFSPSSGLGGVGCVNQETSQGHYAQAEGSVPQGYEDIFLI
jgi:hypothetical protein